MVRLLLLAATLAGCRPLLGLDPPVLVADAQHGDGAVTDGGPSDVRDDSPPGSCAVDAAAVPSSVTITGNAGATTMTISNISLAGSQMPTVAAGSTVTLQLDYSITDTACATNCIDQIEIGFVPGNRVGCMFDGSVPKSTGVMGTAIMPVMMPATPGRYDFRVNLGENFSCTYNGASTWWASTPPPSLTIARVCVAP